MARTSTETSAAGSDPGLVRAELAPILRQAAPTDLPPEPALVTADASLSDSAG